MIRKIGKITLGILVVIGLLAVVTFILAPKPPKTPDSAANVAELEAYLNDLVASETPPGLSVTVVKAGEEVYSKGFGYADLPNGVEATPDTVYHWWSMTKVTTAVAILQLAEQGKLSLDDPVVDHLPFFQVEYPSADSEVITIRHLLNHTSGLPDMIPDMLGWVHTEDMTMDQTAILKTQLPSFNTLKYEPGRDAAYTNLSYLVLGAVIEAVSGQSYEAYIRENVLQPLAMNDTDFIYRDEMAAHEAMGSHPFVSVFTPMLPFLLDMDALVSQRVGTQYWFKRVYLDVTPSTGLIGSAPDAAVLMLDLLRDEPQLLTAESTAAMQPTGDQPGERPLGWAEFGQENGRSWVQHRGGGPGFATVMRLYPEEDLGVLIMANNTNLDNDGLAELMASLDW
jgi:CubicO group peptidase (beta-lactamase class C family)